MHQKLIEDNLNSKVRITSTQALPNPNQYVQALLGEYAEWALSEDRAPLHRGRWRAEVLRVADDKPVDLEIGTGNGYFFAHQALAHPERCLLGIELKYKPLIQSIRRALRGGARNARIMRYDAYALEELFAPGELNDVFIHFPDPWEKKRHWKHRLIDDGFLTELARLQRPGSHVDFKTDSLDYFEWAVERFKRSPYELIAETRDLYQSEWSASNFQTHFERLWLSKGLKINFARLCKK